MKRFAMSIALAVLCSGCAAHMMETHGDKIELFRLGQPQKRGGVVRYGNNGFASWKTARRADAERQMREFCKGPYAITAEGPRSKFGADMPIGPHSSLEIDQFTYVRFECTP